MNCRLLSSCAKALGTLALTIAFACDSIVVLGQRPNSRGNAGGLDTASMAANNAGGSAGTNTAAGGTGTVLGGATSNSGAVQNAGANANVAGNAVEVPFRATHEFGNAQEWLAGGWENQSDGGYYDISTAYAHEGSRALRTVTAAGGDRLAQAVVGRNVTLTSGRYGAWYYLPTAPTTDYWVIMKFASLGSDGARTERFDLDITSSGGKEPHLLVYEHGGAGTLAEASLPFPVGRWTHLEARYVADSVNGRLIVLQDGVVLFDSGTRATADSARVAWSVGSSTYYLQPSPFELFIDDATIDADTL